MVMVAMNEAELVAAAEEVRAANPAVAVRALAKDLATPEAARSSSRGPKRRASKWMC